MNSFEGKDLDYVYRIHSGLRVDVLKDVESALDIHEHPNGQKGNQGVAKTAVSSI